MESVRGDLSDVVRGGGGGGFHPSMEDMSVVVDLMDYNYQELSAAEASPFASTRLMSKPAAPVVPPAAVSRAPGVKRRKGQAKKVIVIPAPAADQEGSNVKSSVGVVVPSDPWAWRKYGQKPIKGSPHPRGYYRCSSSKGCLARKQVERSRTDPNMLVITYTSDHDHPWPTHRNSLAGSSRSTNTTAQLSIPSKNPTSMNPHIKDEAILKEENIDFVEHVFGYSYEPMMLDYPNDTEFFDGLGGLEPNPMHFIFNKLEDEEIENKDGLDALSYFDWDDILV